MATDTTEFLEVSFVDSQDDYGSNEVIVLVHGTGGTTDTHYTHLYPMLAQYHRVVGVDWTDPDTETLETQQLVDQVLGVIDQLRLHEHRITLVGYSLGAVIASLVAAQQPQLISNLVLISGWVKTDNQQLLRNQLSTRLAETDPEALAQFKVLAAFSGTYLASISDEQVEGIVANMQSTTAFDAKQMELNRRISIAGVLGRISAHTLVVGCQQDIMVPIRHQLQLAEAIADAEFVTIDAGHAVVFERPAELADHILEMVAHTV
ncbi:MAG TPA: alpha/beta hydrolase [Enteractinococcus helveticum]|uniref:Alpha/beta hydrolase n=1 Tax=Enteractinococcus helveticum TaxID=1837282 RepID=A0A921FQK1_9MICC|nr:alpha/beta hydrolase [Enteractinococcus helveticum]HJF15317.1 alpha/beta hydrolase [Enteractinococcus helveticum]